MNKTADLRTTGSKKGIEGKLIRYAVFFVLLTGMAIFAAFLAELFSLQRRIKAEDTSESAHLKEQTLSLLSKNTTDSLLQLVAWAADKTDDEFRIIKHDISVLAAQAEDILTHPAHYEALALKEPGREDSGELTLQLLKAQADRETDPAALDKAGRLANLAPAMEEIVRGNKDHTMDCYIALPEGLTLAMDAAWKEKVDDSGSAASYDARERSWYKAAVKTGDVVFSSVMHSYFYDLDEIVCSIPVYIDGKLSAVIAASAQLKTLQQILRDRNIGNDGFSVLVNGDGSLFFSPKTEGELAMDQDSDGVGRKPVKEELQRLIEHAQQGETGVAEVEVDRTPYYAACAPLPTLGWTQIMFVSVREIMAPAEALLDQMKISAKQAMLLHMMDFRHMAAVMAAVLILVLLLSVMLIRAFAKRRVVPLARMAGKVQEFTDNEMTFAMEEVYRTGDEIQVLAEAFAAMSERIRSHLENLVEIKAEQKRIFAELSMAAQIQGSMLPGKLPERAELQLFASMVPAKNVGGDFYDFFYADEDHLAFLIADVSGKGITAALFMAQAMQVLRAEVLLHGTDLGGAVSAANKTLFERSVRDMFVTLWLGVLTLSDGRLLFVNAGHEYAAMQRGGESFRIEKDLHSVAAAALKNPRFKVNELTLSPGDALYLYTDGVLEARRKDGQMFGPDRLLKALNEDPGQTPEKLDEKVRTKIAEYVGDTEQYDDITTLCIRYLGSKEAFGEK